MSVVLLVNDYPPHIALLALQTILLNHQIVTAPTPEEAVEIAGKLELSLVIFDINLGENDNLEAIPTLRQSEALRSVPMLVVSGRRDYAYEENALAAGADAYLVKPFDPADFREAVEHCLDGDTL